MAYSTLTLNFHKGLNLSETKLFFKKINLFIFVCVWAFSSCGEPGLLFVVVRGLLVAVPSLVAEHGL